MKNEIMRFVNEKFGEIRGVEIDGEPWLVGKDIAKVLGYSDPSGAILKHVDSEDKNFVMLATVTDSQNGNVPISKSKTTIINESGLYSLIMSSKLPEAKPVFAWIREELENYKEQKKQALALPKEANNVQLFENREFGRMRSITINGEPWFVAKDVCDILDIQNPTVAVNRLDEDERTKYYLGRQGLTNVVNEYGLYNLILVSRKNNAKKFKRWVTHEVLPVIRKTGGYINPNLINNDEFAYRTINMLVDKIYLLGQKK